MSLDFASFAVTHKKVKFFTRMTPASIDLQTGELNFENEDEFFGNRHVIAPPEVVALLPYTAKGQALDTMNQLFVPELEETGSDLLLRVPEVVIESLTEEIEDQGGKWKDLRFKACVTRTYFARTIAQLTRAEIKTVNSMSMNIIAMLKEVDPEAVEEIMRLMQEDSESDNENSAKADTFINIKISVDHPELADRLTEVRTKQMIKRLSMMMKLPVEFLSDVYETMPNGEEIVEKIDRDLRGIKDDDEDKDKEGDNPEEKSLSTDVVTGAVVVPAEEEVEEPEAIAQQTVTVKAEEVEASVVDDDESSDDESEEDDEEHEDSLAEYDRAMDEAENTEDEEADDEPEEEIEEEPVPRKRKTRKARVTA